MVEKRISFYKLKKLVSQNYGFLNSLSGGNLFTPLTSSQKIYREFYSSISNAKKSINMEFFIFQADDVGKRFADLLCKKAKEGVKVNVILDFLGAYPFKERARLYQNMIKEGVNLRFSLSFSDIIKSLLMKGKYFRRGGIRLFFRRNHRKILVIDGETAYTGGVNIGKQYFWSEESEEDVWHDFQFKVQGPAVNFFQAEFFRTWISDGGKIDIKNLHLYFKKQEFFKDGIYLNVLTNSFGKFNKLLKPIIRAIHSARKYVYVENPYLLNRKIVQSLCDAAERGINVVVLTSLEKQDFNFMRIFVERSLIKLHKSGVKVFIYPKTLLHGKAMLIDGKIAIVGTANLNNRSFYWDYELNMEVFDRNALLQIKKEIFEKDLVISERFTRTEGKFFSKFRYALVHFLENFS